MKCKKCAWRDYDTDGTVLWGNRSYRIILRMDKIEKEKRNHGTPGYEATSKIYAQKDFTDRGENWIGADKEDYEMILSLIMKEMANGKLIWKGDE